MAQQRFRIIATHRITGVTWLMDDDFEDRGWARQACRDLRVEETDPDVSYHVEAYVRL